MTSQIAPAHLRGFIARTERSISPRAVALLYRRAESLAKLPLSVQRWIVAHARGEEYMGFVVDPYALFLAYEIVDPDAAARMLPPAYRLVETTMFADEDPRVCAIVGAFSVRTSVLSGSRVELYLIAEDTRTGMLTWVICDYESNTINYDPGQGFSGATTERSVVTTSHRAEVIVDVESRERPNRLAVSAPLETGAFRPLDQRLWIDGNLSVDYGGRLMHDGSEPFGLIFDPGEMAQALQIPASAVEVSSNTFGTGMLAAHPFQVACFPYAQHFLTTAYPRDGGIRDQQALEEAVRAHAEG